MPTFAARLESERHHQITFHCLGGLEYTGQVTDVNSDHLDLRTEGGRVVRLPYVSIVALDFQPES
jgi:hypothetical protein